MEVFGYRSYEVPGYVSTHAYVRNPALVGAVSAVAPLKNKPTLVTKSDIRDYMNLIASVHDALVESANKNLVSEDPGDVHDRAEKQLRLAADLDGCVGPMSCTPDGTEDPDTISFVQYPIWSYRNRYWRELARARFLENIVKRREMKRDDVRRDLDLSAALDSWTERFEAQNKKMPTWSAVDWDEVERLDLDLQALRNRYQLQTRVDLGDLPSKTPDRPNAIPWAAILIVGGVLAAALLLGQVRSFVPVPALRAS